MGIGIYLHLPFCASKCHYCNFYSAEASRQARAEYLQSLIDAIALWPDCPDAIDTVYFGGGTPSLFAPAQLGQVLAAIQTKFHLLPQAEITMEANPETVTPDRLAGYQKAGLNRISFGVQSFCDQTLAVLGRRHDAAQAKQAILWAKEAGFENVSLDLMLGLPNQTKEALLQDLQMAAALSVQHISAYLLKVEEGTLLAKKADLLHLPNSDTQGDFYELLCEQLPVFGFEQYEISNFAKKGFASRHNLHYWRREPYLAFGPSAHLFCQGKRLYYPADRLLFQNMVQQGVLPLLLEDQGTEEVAYQSPPAPHQSVWPPAVITNTPHDEGLDALCEEVMLRLRLTEGLCFADLKARYGHWVAEPLRKTAAAWPKELVRISDKRLNFTPKGFALSNELITQLLLALEEAALAIV